MATDLDINKGFVAIEVTEEQQLAAEHLFDNTITKTMVDVKLEVGTNGLLQLQFQEHIDVQSRQALSKAFWIGYNVAKIENGH